MKKLLIAAMLLSVIPTAASADVYVAVDADGNAVGGAIVCDAGTCGEGSLYSQLTLQAGQRYVLQGYGQAGIGNNNPDTSVKVDIPTQTWTVTTPTSVQQFQPTRETAAPIIPVRIDTSTATETSTATIDTSTATIDTSTAVIADLRAQIKALYALIQTMFIRLGWSL